MGDVLKCHQISMTQTQKTHHCETCTMKQNLYYFENIGITIK